MAEGKSSPADAAAQRTGGLELRLEQRRAYACLSEKPIATGARVVDLTMEVPDVRFPFDVGRGASQFSRRLCELARVEVAVSGELLAEVGARLDLPGAGLGSLALALRPRFVEGAGRLEGGVPFTFQAAIEPEGDQVLSIVVYEVRLYGLAALPAAALPMRLARAAVGFARQDGAALRIDALPAILRKLLPPRGWKLPRSENVRLAGATATPGELSLVWDRGQTLSPRGPGVPPDGPPVPPQPPPIGGRAVPRAPASTSPPGRPSAQRPSTAVNESLLAAIEGVRAFREAEALLFRGDWQAAREAYLSSASATAHPFAAGRLLSLLAIDERFHDEALDLAAHWLSRRPDFAPALVAEGVLRARRGEAARASRAFAELAAVSARRGEEFGALAAAEACFALGAEADPAAAARAVETALALRRDHLPALRTLLAVAERTGDREALLRACRRLAAYAPVDAEKARAHARLAEILLRTDAPSARLHLDQALRLAPDDVASLSALARACEEAGEYLRALRAHDRLRELHLAAGDTAAAALTALAVGVLWEERLGHPENALLRYREACELAPDSIEARERAARAADSLGHWAEAAEHHAGLLAAIAPGVPGGPERASRAHRALARVAEERLGDSARAASHLEAVLALEPQDAGALGRLAALYRTLDRPAELLATLDRLAPLTPSPSERARLLAEAGTAALSALALPEAARSRFGAALALDPQCRPALEGMRRIAAGRGDAQAERDALSRLVLAASDRAEQATLYDQLAQACERAGDLAAASRALASARRADPSYSRLAEMVRIARLAGEGRALAALLAEQASAAQAAGDPATAARAWIERASLLGSSDPAAALAALSEARALAPGDAALLRAQADLAEAAGDPILALGALRALLSAGVPDAGAVELRAARAAKAAGDLPSAREHADRALAGGEGVAAALLAEIMEACGDRVGRADLLERTGRLMDAARAWIEAGSPERARTALARASDDPASAAEALPLLAEARFAAGDRAGGAEALLRLARLRGGTEGARICLRAAETDPDRASEALDAAVGCDPAFLPARVARAERIAGRDPQKALSDCEAVLGAAAAASALDPARRRALMRLASSVAMQLGRAEEARRHLARYCDEAPDDGAALSELAQVSRAAGDDTSLAIALERRLEQAQGPDTADLGVELARLRLRAGAAHEALELLREALRRDPASPDVLRAVLGPELQELVPPADRAEHLARLAALPSLPDAEKAQALVERAQLLASGGTPGEQTTAALEAARAAARLDPSSAGALDLVADLARRSGDARTAAEALLARSLLAREAAEPDAATRLAFAGHAAHAAGLAGPAEEALRAALSLGLDPEEKRLAWATLADRAHARQDADAERTALEGLLPLLRTGERPAHLLRLSALRLAEGDFEAARRHAEEARTLSPRDLASVEACREVAERQGDWPAVADRLAEAAGLAPERAGPWLLARARLLADLERADEADRAYTESLARLPPDAALAAEHARRRRQAPPPVCDRPWSEPLEALSRRTPDVRSAAVALRDAAYLALLQDDPGAAVRCSRKAYARTREEPAFAGPLLARVLYRQGSGAEALVLHRALFEAGFAGVEESDSVVLCRQLAELAEDAGEAELALAALEKLLELRPQDGEAAEWRFRLDPDRARAVRALAQHAAATRSTQRRARAHALAAVAAQRELADPALADALWRKAMAAAGDYPQLLAALESERLAAARLYYDPSAPQAPAELLSALHDAAAASEAAGNGDARRALLEEAVEIETRHGLLAEALADLRALEESWVSLGQPSAAAAYARQGGLLVLERARDLERAEAELRRAVGHHRGDELSWRGLEAIARARGNAGALLLAEAIAAQAELVQDPAARADLLAALGAVLAGPLQELGRAAAALRAALALAPGHRGAEEDLVRVYRALGRSSELGRLLLERAARSGDLTERLAMYREAGEQLAALPDVESRTLAADALLAALADAPGDLALTRAAADLLLGLERREEAVPLLAALVRADPEDEQRARDLAEAYGGRHRERAEVSIERAAGAEGQVRAARLREAAKALFAAGEEERARGLLRDAFEAWPADDGAFREAIRDAAPDVDRLDAVLAARARAVPSEAAGCHRARADALAAFGRAEDALRAYQDCLAVAPDDVVALAMVAEHLAERQGDQAAAEADARLFAVADASPGVVPSETEARARYRGGLLAWARGTPEEGITHLEKALALSPSDPRAGLAWAAVANGYASRGMGPEALRAARHRADRAAELGLAEERREAVEAGAALSSQFEDRGEDAAALLEASVALQLGESPDAQPAFDALLERTLQALARCGENARAQGLLALAARAMKGERRKVLLQRIGESALARGDRLACRAAWAEAQALDPSDAALRAKRLAEARDSGDAAAHAVVLEESLASGEPDPALLLDLARARQALGDPAAAAGWYQKLLALGPTVPGHGEALRAVVAQHHQTHDDRALAAEHQRRAQTAATPALQAEEHLAAAASLEQAGAPPAEVRSEIESACAAAPDDVPGWKALADFENRKGEPLAAARGYLAVAIRAEGEEAAQAAMSAAALFESTGRILDATRAYTTAIHARPGSYAARQALARLAMQAGDPSAAAEHLAATDPSEVPPHERIDQARARAGALEAAGRPPDALEFWRKVFAADPADADAFDRVALQAREQRRIEEWLELAARHDAALAAAGDAARRRDLRCQRARLLEEMGRLEAAEGAWRAALEIDPDFTAARDALGALHGNKAAWAEAAEQLRAEAERTSDHAQASALLMRCARILHEKLSDADAAGRALEAASERSRAAAALAADEVPRAEEVPRPDQVPQESDQMVAALREELEVDLGDLAAGGEPSPSAPSAPEPVLPVQAQPPSLELEPSPPPAFETAAQPPAVAGHEQPLVEIEASRGETAAALESALETARRSPSDGAALETLAAACRTAAEGEQDGGRAARLLERARVAEALAGLASPEHPAAEPPPLALRVPAGVRERAAAAGAVGPVARLLSLLAPWLEGLFPADLPRRGAAPTDRIGPANAPSLLARVELASRALSARGVAVFISHRAGTEPAIENTQPPSIVLHSPTVLALRPSGLAFLLARQLDLCGAGWALVGKFAPRDIGILCELTCRFAGGEPPPLGLPAQRAGAFIDALAARVPATVREQASALGSPSAEELRSFDPRPFADALRHTANRVALLYTGEPRGALEALARFGAKPETAETPGHDGEGLLSPEARELALFALSDLYLELRLLLVG